MRPRKNAMRLRKKMEKKKLIRLRNIAVKQENGGRRAGIRSRKENKKINVKKQEKKKEKKKINVKK